ncbi:MAG: hypothetical protein INH41_18670 [Myxococcaceae bacterium]|nr:hypothetical protein [Myxococcaceae bacterium]MCA3014412.1 hypothetical protein [Myxococcaceae bacterium]
MSPDEALLVERVVSAHRERGADGAVRSHPAWHDLGAEGRRAAYEETARQRAAERALDPNAQSSTVKAVLARLSR